MNNIIDEYINSVLSPRLEEYGVSSFFQNEITDVIREQMISALYHWKEMRNVFYTLTAEEALFYMPDAPDDVKVFVVLTVRNSPIETLQSDNYKQAGLTQRISDEQLKRITSEAILFFKRVKLHSCNEIRPISDEDDLYGYLKNVYCIAWRTLEQISISKQQSCSFSSFAYQKGEEKSILDPYRDYGNSADASVKVVADGFDISIDNTLFERLTEYAENHGIFYVDCFKMITRNVEKLFAVIEFLMANDAVLLTANYLLEHTSAEKRKRVVRAASSKSPFEDMLRNLRNSDGLTEKHKKYLSAVSF